MLAEDLINCVESQVVHLHKCSVSKKSMASLDTTGLFIKYVYGLVQERLNSSALAMELHFL